MEPVRFTDILTTALSVANYLREPSVDATHIATAIALVDGSVEPEDLGRPRAALRWPSEGRARVEPEVAVVVQRWWRTLGEDPLATISDDQIREFKREVEAATTPAPISGDDSDR